MLETGRTAKFLHNISDISPTRNRRRRLSDGIPQSSGYPSTVPGLDHIPNYDVTTAVDIIPAADLSQQISTAGLEASGTGNMKLALNGALTMGTMDGANIEMREQIGDENIFIFRLTTDGVQQLKPQGYRYRPRHYYESNPALKQVVDMIGNGFFSPNDPNHYRVISETLLNSDPCMVLADFRSYMEISDRADSVYRTPKEWTRMAILNTARMGYFSSDRTIKEYTKKIWGIEVEEA